MRILNENPSLEEVKKLQPNSREIYCYPYSHLGNFTVEYTHSGRKGLRVEEISFRDFKSFFLERYCCNRWDRGELLVKVPENLLNQLLYGEEMHDTIETPLNEILKTLKYEIEDEEKWGEYSLRYLYISEENSKPFFDFIEKRLQQLKR